MKRKIMCIAIASMFLLTGFTVMYASGIKTDGYISINEDGEDGNVVINLKKGDIVFRYVDEELFPLFKNFLHPMIFTGRIIDFGGAPYYQFAEAHGGKGACYSLASEERILSSHDPALLGYIYRVKEATPEQINNAMAFAEWRIAEGDPFLEIYKNPIKNYDPYENNSWYCTEYVWAAYFNCKFHYSTGVFGFGIDIDANQGVVILPSEIQESPNVEKIPLISQPQDISIPKSRTFNLPLDSIIARLSGNHPNMFPILRALFKL